MTTEGPAIVGISVIIPAFNGGAHIVRALDSVMMQGAVVQQIIVVDDGSTDDTFTRVRNWEQIHGLRVTLLQQANAGASASRNVGMAHATGTYVQFLDADDELLPGKLAHQLKLAEAHGWPELVVGRGREVAPDGSTVRIIGASGPSGDPWMDLMEHRMSITSCNLWLRQAVSDAGGWNAELRSSQEYDLMFRMLQCGARVVYDEQVLAAVHQRPGQSISHTNKPANWQRYVDLRARIVAHVAGLGDGRDLQPYHQVLFDNIRMLYQHDPSAALAAHRDLLPADFRPGPSPGTGRAYLIAYRLLGFKGAEQLRARTAVRS